MGWRGSSTALRTERWVGDTTEFVIGSSGKLYLAAVLDLFSRFIVGWAPQTQVLHLAMTHE